MAIKDITLGQYFPGDTVIHRLDPRTKLLLTVAYIVALFLARSALTYAVMLLALVACVILSRINLKVLLKSMRAVIFIVVITGILNLFYTPGEAGEEPLLSVWVFRVYPAGVWAASFMVLRILLLISCTFLLTYTTSPILITDALEQLLGPLKKLHMPIHELAMMMSIALRFIPTLVEETDKIMSAQKARGASFDTGNLVQKAKALIPLLVPLFISAFRRADELAIAMECRCYHGGEGRTRLMQLRFAPRDYVALSMGLVLGVGVWTLGYLGM